MSEYDHPAVGSANWDNPDFCPFCGTQLPDGGPGFIDHIEQDEYATCRDRFEEWRDNVADDVGGEWVS